MLIVVTNRSINQDNPTDETLFGETPNKEGIDEIRLATATYDASTKRWSVKLRTEPDDLRGKVPPSQQLFNEVLTGIKVGTHKKTWVFFIHGFNQSFAKGLEAGWQLSQLYDVGVILFSWPSNPGGFVTDEYRRARQAAKASANALDRTLDKLGSYLLNRPYEEIQQCPVSLNLMAHSLGNFMLESVAREPIFIPNVSLFKNLIIHQADVDNRLHQYWIDRVDYGTRIYVTINEEDLVLKASDLINPNRLGNTVKGLNGDRPIYVDFTDGSGVGGAHNLFTEVQDNPAVVNFCRRVLHGQRGEVVPGFEFNDRVNAFQLKV
jgi:esterase/lipase superfamily enzyme